MGNSLHAVSKEDTPPPVLPTNQSPALQEADTYHRFSINGTAQSLRVKVKLNCKDTIMEMDTGASLSLVDEATYAEIASEAPLKPTIIKLCTYAGETL